MVALSPACAVILDFQEPTDRTDAASSTGDEEAATTEGPNGSVDGAPMRSSDAADRDLPPRTSDLDSAIEDGAAPEASDGSSNEPVDGSGASSESGGPLLGSCAGCVPSVPSGWFGPLAMYESTKGGALPPCAGDFPEQIYDGSANPIAASAECSCTCSAPSGATCSPPETTFYADAACLQSCGSPTASGPGELTCAKPITQQCDTKKIRTFSVSASIPSGGACTPTATAQVPAATWSSTVRLCRQSPAVAGSTCDAGGACAGSTLPPFGATNRCVLRPGAWACPSGYPVSRTFYETAADTRACSSCSCESPAGIACSASVSTYDKTACSGAAVTRPAPVACETTSQVERLSVAQPVPVGGACAATGGTPTGAFTPETPSTVCCLE